MTEADRHISDLSELELDEGLNVGALHLDDDVDNDYEHGNAEGHTATA